MKNLFHFRLGSSSWSLSLGEYLFLVVAVLGGWLLGGATSRQPVSARSATAYQVAGGTNASTLAPGVDRGVTTD